MHNRTTLLILSAVLIAAILSGCVQETSEIGTPQPNVTPPSAPAPGMYAPPSITNWEYVSYSNLSISNAPALNQTARITYSIIPDRDIEDLLVYVSLRGGFEIVDVGGERLLNWGRMPVGDLDRCARWRPTNLSKGEMYQFNVTIKAVKAGNFTIIGSGWEDKVYVSVSEDSAMARTALKPSERAYLRPGNFNNKPFSSLRWDETSQKWVKRPANMTENASELPEHNFTHVLH